MLVVVFAVKFVLQFLFSLPAVFTISAFGSGLNSSLFIKTKSSGWLLLVSCEGSRCSQTLMARTSLGPWKFVLDMSGLSL